MSKQLVRKADCTHLAGEFYFLSCLNRKRKASVLTLGNHKSVDIFVFGDDGKQKSVDVKAVDKSPVYLGNKVGGKITNKRIDDSHYYAVVYFGHLKDSYSDTNIAPRVFILPSSAFWEMASRHSANQSKGINLRLGKNEMAGELAKYENAYELLD